MEVALALLCLLAVTSCSFLKATGACRLDGKKCFDDLVETLKRNQDEKKEVFCGKIKKSVDCLAVFAETCINDEKMKMPQEIIDRMIKNANSICSRKSDDSDLDNNRIPDEKKTASCVRDSGRILSHVGECSENLKHNIKSNASWKNHGNKGDSICQNYLYLSNCTSKKMSEDCGEHIEKLFWAGMVKQLKKTEPTGATSLKCAEAIEEAEEYLSSLQHHTE